MKTIHSRIVLVLFSTALLFMACGCKGGTSAGNGSVYTLSGLAQKGPFAIGSQISVNELDNSLNPTGKVYNVQTTDSLGNFAVSSEIGTNLVEIAANGFYMDELTGQLASSQIQIRAIADLGVNTKPTVNVLTSLQGQRLKSLLSQGHTYTAANAQSQTEVLAAFGIDSTKVNSLSNLYSMQINGSTDADAVLLATSVILSKMAANAAVANGTNQSAELSNYINTLAAEIANTGAITDPTFIPARNLAATQIDLSAVRANLETYYANRGVIMVAPKFEEWVDHNNSGVLPQRLVPVSGLLFIDASGVEPQQLITSNMITVSGLGTGVAAPVTASPGTTIIKNNTIVSGTIAIDGDTIAMRVTSLGFGLSNTSTITVGSTSATWRVTTKPLGGAISGLTGTGLVLQNNVGGDTITIPAGSTSFTFNAPIANGRSYDISVLSPPTTPLQACTVTNGAGMVGAAVSSVSVSCSLAEVAFLGVIGQDVSAHLIDITTGALTSCPRRGMSGGSHSIAVDPSVRFVYAVSSSNYYSSIRGYSINASTAALTPIYISVPGSIVNDLQSITLDPSGKYAYVVYNYDNQVSAFSINATTGAQTSIGTYAVGTGPNSLAVDPSGKFAYVVNNGSNNVSAFSINTTTGALTSIGTFTVGTNPNSLAVDPSGKFAYVTNNGSNNVSAFSINTTTGALTSIGTLTVGTNPRSLTVDPSGKFAYVVNNGSNNVSAFSINTTTGALTSIGTLTVGTNPRSLTVDPSGKFAYVTNYGSYNISAFSINATTGALTSIGTFCSAEGSISAIAITRAP